MDRLFTDPAAAARGGKGPTPGNWVSCPKENLCKLEVFGCCCQAVSYGQSDWNNQELDVSDSAARVSALPDGLCGSNVRLKKLLSFNRYVKAEGDMPRWRCTVATDVSPYHEYRY